MDGACWACFCCQHSPFRTWMSGSFESVQWNDCAQTRLRFILSSKKVLGEWSENPCKLQGKNPFYQWNSPQRRIKPMMLHQARQQAQHTTKKLFRPPLPFSSMNPVACLASFPLVVPITVQCWDTWSCPSLEHGPAIFVSVSPLPWCRSLFLA